MADSQVSAQLEVIRQKEPQCFFPGAECPVGVSFHNPGDHPATVKVRTQLYQASSSTVAPLGSPQAWKALEILAGQTILETNPLAFPSVANATRFIIEWLDDTNRVLGTSDVVVFPTNLLEALRPLAYKKPIGVLDPQNELIPALTASGLAVQELNEDGIDEFSGRLAIIRPISTNQSDSGRLANEVTALARSGAAVVWIKAEAVGRSFVEPELYCVRFGNGAVSLVRPRALMDLASNPVAQLNLVRAAQLAARPDLLIMHDPKP